MTVVVALVRLSLLSTEEGGRTTGLRSPSFRPNHNFGTESEENFRIGEVRIPRGQVLEPGSTGDFEVYFAELLPDAPVRELLLPGREWRLQEGPRLIGFGKLMKVLN